MYMKAHFYNTLPSVGHVTFDEEVKALQSPWKGEI